MHLPIFGISSRLSEGVKMKKLFLIVLLAVSLISGAAAAPYYDAGSQMFSINVGPTIPFFTYNGKDNQTLFWPGLNEPGKLENTNEYVGGIGSISYQVFLNEYWALGGELGYQFNYVAGTDIFASVPINLKVSYYPVQTGVFDLPISLAAGLNYISFKDNSKLTFSAKLEIGGMFYFNDEWGLGAIAGLNFIPEIYLTEDRKIYSGIEAYIPITVSVAYRH